MEYIHQLTHDQTPAEVKNKTPVYNTHRREPLAHGGKYQPGIQTWLQTWAHG